MLVALKKTLVDVGAFVMILLVFMLPYGIMQQNTVFPNGLEDPDLSSVIQYLTTSFLKPYFQLYGEIFIAESTDYAFENVWADTPCVKPLGTVSIFIYQ
jgi:hypothetical protein